MILCLIACVDTADTRSPKPEDDGPPSSGTVTSHTYSATTDANGFVEIPVEVEDGEVFQVILRRGRGLSAFEYVYDPAGDKVLDWEALWDSPRSLTDCIIPARLAIACNWPVRAIDGPLEAGTWTVVGTTVDSNWDYQGGEDVEIEVLTRPEPDVGAGSLRAVVAYAEGVGDDEAVVSATERAVEYWGELFAGIGVTLEVEFADIPLDPDLPAAYSGQDEVETLLAGEEARSVLVVIGETVEGDDTLYGEAAAIPGPYAPTPITVVEIGWLANAGADATFRDPEVLLMGETIAHEVGHYLGLYHPVEDGGYGAWEWWDALEDTAECDAWRTCESELGHNLMFPYPLCGGGSACERQDEITGEQAGVINHYVGVE
ncbi:MAG: hypothetical protein ACOZNI_28145 [Myxococcota bacterium]